MSYVTNPGAYACSTPLTHAQDVGIFICVCISIIIGGILAYKLYDDDWLEFTIMFGGASLGTCMILLLIFLFVSVGLTAFWY